MIELKDKIGKENTDKNAPDDAKEFVQEFFSLRKGLLNYISPELVNYLADDLGLTGLDFIGPQGLAMASAKVTAAKGAPKFLNVAVENTMDKLMKTWGSKANQKKRIETIFGKSKALDDMINEGSDIFKHDNPKKYFSATDVELMAATGDKIQSTPVRTFVFRALNQQDEVGKDLIGNYMLHVNKSIIDEIITPLYQKHSAVLENKATRNVFTQRLDRLVDEDVFFYANNGQKNSIYLDTKDAFDLPFSKLQGGTDIYGITPFIFNPLDINNKGKTSDPYYGATKDDSFVDIMTGLRASTKDLINKAKDKDNITVGQLLSNYIPKDKVEETAKKLARFTAVPEIGLTKSLADNLPLQNGRKMTSVLAGLVRYTTDSNTYDKLYSPIFNNSKLVNQLSHNALQYLPNDTDADTLPEIPLHELISPEESRALEAFASPVPAIDKAIKNTNFFVDQKEKPKPAPQHKVDAVGEFVKQMGGNKK